MFIKLKLKIFNYFLLLFTYSISFVFATNLTHFSETQIWGFLRSVPRHKLQIQCALSLDRVERFLTDLRTLEEQRFFFSEAFSTGVCLNNKNIFLIKFFIKIYL